jgi:DNA-binding NtrC family response regulator
MSFHNILVVDANVESADRLSRTLSALGYHVEVAGDGRDALRIAQRGRFDVGIVSEVLPDGDGARLFEKLAALQQGIRGVLIAAAGNLSSVWSAVSAGMLRVVTRPVDFSQVLPVVECGGSVDAAQVATTQRRGAASRYSDAEISELTSEEIHYQLSNEELVAIIRSVDYPFAGKERLPTFDRDTLERVVHLVRRWCQSRCSCVPA